MEEQSRDATVRAKQLQDLQSEWRQTLQKARVSGLVLGIIDTLFANPVLAPTQITNQFKVTHQAAMQALRRLESAGIILEITGKKRNRLYAAPHLLKILQ